MKLKPAELVISTLIVLTAVGVVIFFLWVVVTAATWPD